MARTGGYRRSAVWRPWGVMPHAVLQNKSFVCSGSRVTISTVMKLCWSVKRGGIIVKRIQRALAHILNKDPFFFFFLQWWFIVVWNLWLQSALCCFLPPCRHWRNLDIWGSDEILPSAQPETTNSSGWSCRRWSAGTPRAYHGIRLWEICSSCTSWVTGELV